MLDELHGPRDAPPTGLVVVWVGPAAGADAIKSVTELTDDKDPNCPFGRCAVDGHSDKDDGHDDFYGGQCVGKVVLFHRESLPV